MTTHDGRSAGAGAIGRATWLGTALFTVTAVGADLTEDLEPLAFVVAVALFVAGCVIFAAAFLRAVNRSRTALIAVSSLFFLSGSAPRAVRLSLLGALAVQVVVALGTAIVKPYTSLAAGTLVPAYGLGLCGLWAARYGRFPPAHPRARRPRAPVPSSGGSPAGSRRLQSEAVATTTGLSVGIDIGGTKCLGVGLANDRVVAEARVPTPEGGEAILATVAELTGRLGRAAGSEPATVGIGFAGLVDREGVVRLAPNVIGANGCAIRADLEQRLRVPVTVDNDATCAVWGEHQMGAVQGRADVVMVTLGTGIGGGIISGGRVCRGANGFGAEVGHMVVDPNGPQCPCGQRGCWERFASGTGLGRMAREMAEAGESERILDLAGGEADEVRGQHVTAAAAEGDTDAVNLMARFSWWVSLGLVNLANICDPEVFVLGGGLSAAGDALLAPTRTTFAKLIQGSGRRPPVEILLASLGDRAGALGAAHLAQSESE